MKLKWKSFQKSFKISLLTGKTILLISGNYLSVISVIDHLFANWVIMICLLMVRLFNLSTRILFLFDSKLDQHKEPLSIFFTLIGSKIILSKTVKLVPNP